MVQMKDVTKIYDSSGTVALDGINLTINEGEFVFLVGPSGSGKSTLMKLITGEIRATAGEIVVNDFDMMKIKMRKMSKVRRTLGVIFQDFRLIENMTIYDNVAFAMRVVGAKSKNIAKRVPYVLELVGLEGRESRFPNELSGGEQQRVAIARALVNNPRMIVADEPTGNLDPVRSLELMLLFEKINEMGTTILVVTHEKELVNAFSKRVITIDEGHVVSDDGEEYHSYELEEGTISDSRRLPQHQNARIHVLRLGGDHHRLPDYHRQHHASVAEYRQADRRPGTAERNRRVRGREHRR